MPAAVQITCPAPIVVPQVIASAAVVSYPTPTTSGGVAPVTTVCSPLSGAMFPLGDTTVQCTATDRNGRQAGCSFSVSLRHRELAVTRFLAFGDSLTEGENGRPGFIDTPNAYPTFLQRMFVERVPQQSITVVNAGRGGERVTENDERLKDRIGATQAQVLLLLEGINDLAGGVSPASVAAALRDSIETAHERGVQFIFVSTLLPTATDNCLNQPGAPRCRGSDIPIPRIVETNQMIRELTSAEGASLVDPFDEFMANRAAYIDIDGLHLRPEGNRALASAFLSRILERIPAPALAGLSRPR
jgi:lysophospholipase L1-like esterase